MKKILLFIFCVFGFCFYLNAEIRTISGTVKDSKGEPIVGAVIMEEGAQNVATVTGPDGRFSLHADFVTGSTLVCSCISFKESKFTIGKASDYTIVLEEDAELLDEVIVVGYGAMRRSDLTGSVTSIKVDEDDAARSTTLDQMLEGRAAGMQVLSTGGSPDAGINIRIRGLSSFGDSEPLYVVDGIVMNCASEELTTIDNSASPTNGLSGINPQDIASIEILKDASATAIYGSLGANGVVLITTKRGERDKPQINLNAGVTVSQALKKMDVLSFDEYLQFLEEYPSKLSSSMLSQMFDGYVDPQNRGTLKVTPMDWQDYTLRTSVSQRYFLSISGNPKSINYMFSLGYDKNDGIVKTSTSENYSMRLNLEKKLAKKLTIGLKNNFAYTKSNLLNGASNGAATGSSSSVLRSMICSRPFAYKNPADEDESPVDGDDELRYGPSRWLTEVKNLSERFRITPSIFLNWNIIKPLTFKSTFGGDFRSETRTQTKTYKLSPTDGNQVGVGKATNIRYNWDNLLTYDFKSQYHKFSVTLGQSYSKWIRAEEYVYGKHLAQPKAEAYAINTADPSYSSMNYSETLNSLMSVFARGVYNYRDRYVLTATYRFDGSSKFQGKNKWSQFPSFAFAWRPVNEEWFKVPVISNMKLRGGWGRVGNQAISNYQTQNVYDFTTSIGNWMSTSGVQMGVKPGNISNPDLKWETSEQFNVGLDISFWKGRLAATVDAYYKTTKDLLQAKNVALSTGFNTIYVNDGSINNKGIEFSLNTTPVKTKFFELNISGNMSFNRNTITGIGESGDSGMIYLSEGNLQQVNYWNGDKLQNSGYTNALNIFIEGQPMGLFYGFKTDGIIQEGETGPGFAKGETRGPGYIKYVDLDGNGYIDLNDRTIIGNPLPKFTYGFRINASFDNFTLKASFSGAYGFDIYNFSNMSDYMTDMTEHNIMKVAWTNAWTPENKSNSFPGVAKTSTTEDGRFSDRYVEDGSYLRLSNIALTYDLPINAKKSKVFKRVAFTLSCDNPFIVTSYSGWSPYYNSFGGNVRRMGVDSNAYPPARSYNFDVKFTF